MPTRDEKRVVWSKLIFDAGISTAKNWLELSDEDKMEIKNAGLPQAVINDLNNYVPLFLLKAPTFKPSKPIGEVLEECRPGAEWDEKRVVWSKLIFDAGISNAKGWLELPDDRKKKIEDEGLPYAVINALNNCVRQGLLLPKFKYAKEVESLRKFTTGPSAVHDEVMSLIQYAEVVDDAWVLTRKDCDVLCRNYHGMAEWTLKALLQGWNKLDDARLASEEFTVYITKYSTPGDKKEHNFTVRYPKVHWLYTLHNLVKDQTDFREHADALALNRITDCSHTTTGGDNRQGDRIDCSEFWIRAQALDPYLLKAWHFMDTTTPTFSAKPTKALPTG